MQESVEMKRRRIDSTSIWISKTTHQRLKKFSEAKGVKLQFLAEQALAAFLFAMEKGAK